MIAIQNELGDYSQRWISFCQKNGIAYKIVDCYSSRIIDDLKDCDVLMWQTHQNNPKDILMSKQLLYALGNCVIRTFPDFNSVWHFDDKVGQKYLLEAIGAPLINSHVFYDQAAALAWVNKTDFPKVYKLRGGAGSQNVRLVNSAREARALINKAFGRGVSAYNSFGSLKERWRKYRMGKSNFGEILSGLVRLVRPPAYACVNGREKGYVYFQDFIPDNLFDIRITYVFNRCFATRRKVRPGDFRASGSGVTDYDQSQIPKQALRIAFDVAQRLKLQTAAFDFVLNKGVPEIVELSYAFGYPEKVFDLGYWDDQLQYHAGAFNPFGWMVEGILAYETLSKAACHE
jgi:glutathione synthase/RimK-type ligase-like ATP-grasp enzyme